MNDSRLVVLSATRAEPLRWLSPGRLAAGKVTILDGDPGLGKQVRTMVGSLASRVDRWRLAVEAVKPWDETARASLYGDAPPPETAERGIEATRDWWRRLQEAGDSALIAGKIA